MLWRHPEFVAVRSILSKRLGLSLVLLVVVGMCLLGIGAVVASYGVLGAFVMACTFVMVLLLLWEKGVVLRPTDVLKMSLEQTTQSLKDTQSTYQTLKYKKEQQAGSLSSISGGPVGAVSLVQPQQDDRADRQLVEVHDAIHQPIQHDDDVDLRGWALNVLGEAQDKEDVVFDMAVDEPAHQNQEGQ